MGFDIIRHNVFRYCGIEGLGGTGGPENVLVEKNLFEWIGWQDAARMSESGGTKMHRTRNLLFRNNVVRHIRHANGIWLDIGNTNDRITGNVFADIPGDVNPHAVHIEGSDALNEIDNNIFDHLTGGILIRDTNHVTSQIVHIVGVARDRARSIDAGNSVHAHLGTIEEQRVLRDRPVGDRIQQPAQLCGRKCLWGSTRPPNGHAAVPPGQVPRARRMG